MLVGETKLGYKVTELVGQGGFGTVYKAVKKNKAMETVRALKHISLPSRKQWTDIYNSMGNDMARTDAYFDTILQEILNEIRILADLTNKGVKNVVWYYENEIEDTPSPKHYDIYLLMEFLTALPSYIETHEIKLRDVIKIGTDILTALVECHKSKIIHRDIKTDNIFVAEDGAYKLGDFGVSKKLSDRSRATSMKGTPNYIAPEVYLGQAYDETVDLYSLGIVLYRLLNYNRNPFMPDYPESYNSEDEDKAFELRMKGDMPSYPAFGAGPLGDVILKSIADKDNRYKSAAEFKADLEAVASQMTEDELNVVVLENMLSGVDFSTFGSEKNNLTQMAKDEQQNMSNNSFANNGSQSFQQQNNSFSNNNSQSFSQRNNSFSNVSMSQQNPNPSKMKIIIPVVIVGLLLTVGGLFFAFKGGSGAGTKNNWYIAPNGKEYYLDSNGDPYKNTAKTINGQTYFFNDEGEKVVDDWFLYNGDYYYIDENGKMIKDDFKKVGSNDWYYLGSDGKMIKDAFFDVKGATYYFDSTGKMKADSLVLVNSSLYYAQVDGAIKKNGWCVNNTYYADEEGKILMNTTTPDGVKVGSDGKRIIEIPKQEITPVITPQPKPQPQPQPVGGNGGSSFHLSATDKAGDDGTIIYSGTVDWGDHLRHTQRVSLDDYGENGSGRITINVTKVKDDGSGEVNEINRVIEEVYDDACDRAMNELPYESFELADTSLATCNDNTVVINYKGEIIGTDGDKTRIQYKVTLDRKNGSANYVKVR